MNLFEENELIEERNELSSQVHHLEHMLDDLDIQVDGLVKALNMAAADANRYRTGYTHTLATLAAISNWMRARNMERSATFIDDTIASIEDEVEGREEEAQEKSE